MLSPDGRAPGARDVLAAILRYILETIPVEPATLRAQLARQVGPRRAEEMLTAAEKLRREGEARGKALGKAEGKREALLLQLRQRFGRLPAATAARIERAAAAELDVWFGRVLTASSLSDVLEDVAGAVPPSKATEPSRTRPVGARRRRRIG